MNNLIPTLFICETTNIAIDANILTKLPIDRQNRIIQSVRYEKAKQLYVASLLLGYVLYQYGATLDEIKTTAAGKQYVESKPCFNVSHSGKYIVIAIDNNEVGVDIQEKISISNTAAKIFFNNEENLTSPLRTEFYYSYIWCRKEALLKCLGVGWNGKNEYKLSVLKSKIKHEGIDYYLTDYTICEDYFLTLCEKNIHKDFAIEEVSKHELELFYRSNKWID